MVLGWLAVVEYSEMVGCGSVALVELAVLVCFF